MSGWGTLTVNSKAREKYALEQGEVLDFAVRFVVHVGDVGEVGEMEGLRCPFPYRCPNTGSYHIYWSAQIIEDLRPIISAAINSYALAGSKCEFER